MARRCGSGGSGSGVRSSARPVAASTSAASAASATSTAASATTAASSTSTPATTATGAATTLGVLHLLVERAAVEAVVDIPLELRGKLRVACGRRRAAAPLLRRLLRGRRG